MKLLKNILLIPGSVTTKFPKINTFSDYSARESSFINIISSVRSKLLEISNTNKNNYTSILLQGSGTYANEAVISSLSANSKVKIFSNGIYGDRLSEIVIKKKNFNKSVNLKFTDIITPDIVEENIKNCNSTHIALVHNETTSGILNPINDIIPIIKKYNKKVIVDAISSYGGIPIDINKLNIDYLIGSSNKCLHGYPGLSFVIANKNSLEECKNNSTSLSLDLYDQYLELSHKNQFRFTPPIQIIDDLNSSLIELINEGGVEKRYEKYCSLNSIVYKELIAYGFTPYLPREYNGPIVSTFYLPEFVKNFDFNVFANRLKKDNIIIYPSPINNPNLIRIGNIGNITDKELLYCLSRIKLELLKFF